jgi:hypothetical protein
MSSAGFCGDEKRGQAPFAFPANSSSNQNHSDNIAPVTKELNSGAKFGKYSPEIWLFADLGPNFYLFGNPVGSQFSGPIYDSINLALCAHRRRCSNSAYTGLLITVRPTRRMFNYPNRPRHNRVIQFPVSAPCPTLSRCYLSAMRNHFSQIISMSALAVYSVI